jgi:tetratricopeptide (TPR) repeat protein
VSFYPAGVGASRVAGHSQLDWADPRAAGQRPRKAANRVDTREEALEGHVLALHASAGNAAVGRFLQREVAVEQAAGGPAATSGTSDGILRYGARGDEVRVLQARLNQATAVAVPLLIDGVFGRKTQDAVRRFQRQHPPLAVDGDAGPLTLAELAKVAPDAGDATTGTGGKAGATDAVGELFRKGKEYYEAEKYALAYDEFSKAYEIGGDTALLWNRAQSLRLLGGRRAEAIALYEQFLASNADADEERSRAREFLEDLRGPGRSGSGSLDTAMVYSLFRTGRELYDAGSYARAYDEFSKAYEITNDPALLWNRAQSLRLLGGRRAETIALYEQVLTSEVPEETKIAARVDLAELRGPGRSADANANFKAVGELHKKGQEHYAAEEYALAYDEFTKAHEITGDPALLWNRAQSLRLLGGRRAETIALYEQVITQDIPDDKKTAAREFLDDLRGPAARDGGPAEKPR